MERATKFGPLAVLCVASVLVWFVSAYAGGPSPKPEIVVEGPHPEHRTFNLGEFQLESGVVVKDFQLSFVTYGTLNAKKSNAILLPSFYVNNHHGYDFLIGQGLAFDTTKYLVIVIDMFSEGLSSSPSNTPPPFDGPNFPEISIRDNVQAQYCLVTEQFGIKQLVAVAGFSMGSQQTFQWAVSYPDFMNAIIPWCGNAKSYHHGNVRLEGFKRAIMVDPAYNGGAYTTPPEKGLKAAAVSWAPWVFSQEWWRRELFKGPPFNHPNVEEHLRWWEAVYVSRDANDLIAAAITWQKANVGGTPGFNGDHEKALRSIKARVLFMPCPELYFPIGDAQYEAKFIRNVKLVAIPSVWGHIAGLGLDKADRDFLNRTITAFLKALPGRRG